MKYIELTQNKTMIVDEDDFNKFKDKSFQYHHTGYAVHSKRINGKVKQYLAHRLIMNIFDSKIKIDHINGDKLDNRKENLRLATTAQNGMNRKKSSNKSSRYKGVHYCNTREKWKVYIHPNNTPIYIGIFNTEIEAALAYNKKAKEIFGEFALINEVPNE